MNYACTDAEVAALEAALLVAEEPARGALRVALAWHLTERDPARAAALADEAQAAPSPDPTGSACLEARGLLVRGHLELFADELDAAAACADDARRRFDAAGDHAGAADAWMLAAQVADARGEVAPREQASLAAIDAAQVSGDALRWGVARLAWARDLAHSDAAAAEALLQAVTAEAGAATDCAVLQMHAELVQAYCASTRGRFAAASGHFQRSCEHGLAAGRHAAASRAASNVAASHINLNELATAMEWLHKALAISRPRGIRRTTAFALQTTAECCASSGARATRNPW